MEAIFLLLDDGRVLGVQRTGTGSPLIIQHGWTGSPLDWLGVVRTLQRHFTCYLWEMRPYFSDNVGVGRMAADIDCVLRTLPIERPLLLGHSMGALVSWEYARRYGCGQLSGLVIVDQSPKVVTDADWHLGLFRRFTPQDNAGFIMRLEKDFVRTVLELVGSGKVLTEKQRRVLFQDETMILRLQRLKTINPRPWIDAWKSFVVQDYRSVLGEITVPTLLIYGGKSNFYGPDVACYVTARIPDATLRLYPTAGHSPHLEQPERFVDDLVAFSKRLHHNSRSG